MCNIVYFFCSFFFFFQGTRSVGDLEEWPQKVLMLLKSSERDITLTNTAWG